MIVGAVDIGTNTVLLLIAELRDGVLVPIAERANITRLGEGVDRTRRLSPEASRRTLQAISDYAQELSRHPVAAVAAVGTSALREAEGGSEFLDQAESLLGVRPRIVSGEEEADLTFHGALSGLSLEGPVMVFDVGGGSTEIIAGDAGWASGAGLGSPGNPRVIQARSLDIGSVRLFERHVRHDPPAPEELEAVRADIDRALESAPRALAGSRLLGVAGTVTTLAAIERGIDVYDPALVHGASLAADRVLALSQRLAAMTLEARRAISGLEPKRADVIVVGAEIVHRVLTWAHASELIVSDRGVRWGVAERLARGPSMGVAPHPCG